DPLIAEGNVEGYIVEEERGKGGFGYDPLFFYPPFDKTFGEITSDEKNSVSHRANAIKDLLTKFDEWWEE
ncbi:non-canonical purine NTP pyrophosphatase, partial [Lactobacillus parabuchneri]|nr:non-canonical purine NTP pyrophosphatase [Lentilactobacillus parabuchneri]